jgi:hypothetical protein
VTKRSLVQEIGALVAAADRTVAMLVGSPREQKHMFVGTKSHAFQPSRIKQIRIGKK